MSSLTTPRRLAFRRPDGEEFEAWLGLARVEEANFDVEAWLHPDEIMRLETMPFQLRRSNYVLGHLAAKRALSGILGPTPMRKIAILDGVFGQPIVTGSDRSPGIGIAHSGDWSVALAYDLRHPMGIDIEAESSKNSDAIGSQATSAELDLLDRLCLPEVAACTLLWTVKEALAKTLTTGLMCPFWVYEVDEIYAELGFDTASFLHFKQYRSLSFMLAPGMRCAVALPRRSKILTDKATLIFPQIGEQI